MVSESTRKSGWDTFWRWFNPPLPDVMQASMLRRIQAKIAFTRMTPDERYLQYLENVRKMYVEFAKLRSGWA